MTYIGDVRGDSGRVFDVTPKAVTAGPSGMI